MHSSSEEGFHSSGAVSGSPSNSSDYVSGLQQYQQPSLHVAAQPDAYEQHMFSSAGLQQQHNTIGGCGSSSSYGMQQTLPGLGLCGAAASSRSGPRSDSGADSEGSDKGMKEERLPGAWFYENCDGNNGRGSSPMHDDEYGLRAALSARNVTEPVEVPSSEHVAEIVGRQGCKIKALRNKTNTYIKTPIRGEDPIFMVTGSAEDVTEARKEILLAADHFTQQIRTNRKSPGGGGCSVPGLNAPGHITAYVRVPLRVVGLVVGPKGATIKRIQQDTSTYIITPSREREPIFEVTGMPANVEVARKEIEQHIFQRTGNMPITDSATATITSAEMQSVLQNAAARAKFGGAANQQQQAAAAYAALSARHFGPAAAAADHAQMMANEHLQMQSILRALKTDGVSMMPSAHHGHQMQMQQQQQFVHHHNNHFGSLTPASRPITPPMSIMSMPPPSHHHFGMPQAAPAPSAWSAPLGIVTSSAGNMMSGGLSSADSATVCDWGSNGGAAWSMAPPTMRAGGSSGRTAEMHLTTRLHGLSLMQRDEGLGDSPPTTTQLVSNVGKDSYSMMSAIWASSPSSDAENTAPQA